MLKRFSVKGFRSFCNRVELDFGNHREYGWHSDLDAGDAYLTNGIISNALVLGLNATGKTNLGIALMDVKNNFERRSSATIGSGGIADSSFLNGDNLSGHASFEYVFTILNHEIEYLYKKDAQQYVTYESLHVDKRLVFECDSHRQRVKDEGLALVGGSVLNWDFADGGLSVLGYLSNSLPKSSSPIIYELRSFIDRMDMVSIPSFASRNETTMRALRRIVKSESAVREFESFLRHYDVDERLEVKKGPDGEPVLYFRHSRPIHFGAACSSGTLTLLLLFSRFFMQGEGCRPSFVYIDEFDSYLHYRVAERLIRSFGSIPDSQTVCSTHNTSLMRNVTMRPDCVFVISRKTSEGNASHDYELEIKSLSDRTQREIRRINNVEHLYRNGEFN